MLKSTQKSGAYFNIRFYILLLLLTLLNQNTFTQNINIDNEFIFNPLTDDITKKIPPINVLIDSALINSHRLKYWDKEIKISEYELNSIKREWTDALSFQGELREGSWTSLTYVQDEFGNEVGTLGTTNQGRYYIGLGLRLPIADLWDRGNRIKLHKMQVESNIEKMLEDKQTIRANVMNLYHELVIQQNMLKLDIDNIEFAQLTADMANKEFQNGKMSLVDLSRVRDNLARAQYRFVDTKKGFISSYVMLQEMTGIKFNELNNWE